MGGNLSRDGEIFFVFVEGLCSGFLPRPLPAAGFEGGDAG